MILAIGAAWGAVLLSLLAPLLLHRIAMSIPPRTAVACWAGCLISVIVLAVIAVVAALWPGHGPGAGMTETVMLCLTRVVHAVPHWFADTLAVSALAMTAVLLIRVGASAYRHARAGERVRAYHREVVALVARPGGGDIPVMWLDHPMPMAYSVEGRPGMVVATEGLARRLNAAQRRAVLAHEYAHLRGGHHRILRICAVLASALPWIPLFTAAPRALAALAEFIADESAAAATSPAVIHQALCSVADTATARPAVGLSLAGQVLHQRLRRLESPLRPPRRSQWVMLGLAPLLAASTLGAGVLAAGGVGCLLA